MAWQVWLENEWNQPSRDNWYQMETMATMVRLQHPNPQTVNTELFKIPFTLKRAGEQDSPPEDNGQQDYNGHTKEEYEQYIQNLTYESKARWGMRKQAGYQPPQKNN